MHSCPDCGQACDCDGEDVWWDEYDACDHECEEYDIAEDFDDY